MMSIFWDVVIYLHLFNCLLYPDFVKLPLDYPYSVGKANAACDIVKLSNLVYILYHSERHGQHFVRE
jgi:hypothetical protein